MSKCPWARLLTELVGALNGSQSLLECVCVCVFGWVNKIRIKALYKCRPFKMSYFVQHVEVTVKIWFLPTLRWRWLFWFQFKHRALYLAYIPFFKPECCVVHWNVTAVVFQWTKMQQLVATWQNSVRQIQVIQGMKASWSSNACNSNKWLWLQYIGLLYCFFFKLNYIHFFHVLLYCSLMKKSLNYFFPSSIYTQEPIMTKWKQHFRHFCKFIKKEKLKYHIGKYWTWFGKSHTWL